MIFGQIDNPNSILLLFVFLKVKGRPIRILFSINGIFLFQKGYL